MRLLCSSSEPLARLSTARTPEGRASINLRASVIVMDLGTASQVWKARCERLEALRVLAFPMEERLGALDFDEDGALGSSRLP